MRLVMFVVTFFFVCRLCMYMLSALLIDGSIKMQIFMSVMMELYFIEIEFDIVWNGVH